MTSTTASYILVRLPINREAITEVILYSASPPSPPYDFSDHHRSLLPGRDDVIQNSPEGKIGIYTRLIEFENFRIPLSRSVTLRSCVMFLAISPPWARSVGSVSTLIATSVCPIFVPWYNDVSVKRGPLPSDDFVDLPLLEKLNDNHTLIRKYLETFLCLVGLSRSFVDMDICPTLIGRDKNDIGLLDFVKAADPFKFKIGERTLTDGEINVHSGKNKRKVGASDGSPPIKKDIMGGVSINETAATTAGKSSAVIQKLISQANVDSRCHTP
ncbi:hypothetical protein Tco_1446248 [Tanacetum coccineum]